MTSVMLTTCPEVFPGGAIIAGLPVWVREHSSRRIPSHALSWRPTGRQLAELLREVPGMPDSGRRFQSGRAAATIRSIHRTSKRSTDSGVRFILGPKPNRTTWLTAILGGSGAIPSGMNSYKNTASPGWATAHRSRQAALMIAAPTCSTGTFPPHTLPRSGVRCRSIQWAEMDLFMAFAAWNEHQIDVPSHIQRPHAIERIQFCSTDTPLSSSLSSIPAGLILP